MNDFENAVYTREEQLGYIKCLYDLVVLEGERSPFSSTVKASNLIAVTENTIASERYDAVVLLREISHHIKGGGGGRTTLAQGGGSHPEGLEDALEAARKSVGA